MDDSVHLNSSHQRTDVPRILHIHLITFMMLKKTEFSRAAHVTSVPVCVFCCLSHLPHRGWVTADVHVLIGSHWFGFVKQKRSRHHSLPFLFIWMQTGELMSAGCSEPLHSAYNSVCLYSHYFFFERFISITINLRMKHYSYWCKCKAYSWFRWPTGLKGNVHFPSIQAFKWKCKCVKGSLVTVWLVCTEYFWHNGTFEMRHPLHIQNLQKYRHVWWEIE